MDFGPAYIDYLCEFYTAEQIRGFWKQAGDAMGSRSTCLIHITGTGYQGQTSNGLNLATMAEQAAFMKACQAALARMEGTTTVNPSDLGVGIDFSRSPVTV